MAISRIEDTELVGKTISELSDRPTDSKYAGGDGLTSAQLKQRYDALPKLVKDRLNALIDALTGANDEDLLAQSLKVSSDQTLADFITAITAAVATKYALPEGGIPATDLAEAVTTAIDGKYVKPGTGIPATDLETAVQTSLGKAETAYQKPSGGIPATDLASAVKAILDSAVSQSEFAPVKALAENADKVLTAANYEAVATMLNAAAKTDYKVGQKILIGAGRVPDLWIYFVHDAAVSYTYTTALAFQTALENGTLQIGYYALRPLEAKTELEDYPTKTEMNAAIANNIDADLDTTGKSADAKAVGDAIDALIDGLVEGIITVAEAEYANASTYSQQADIANQISTDREIEDADVACPPVAFGTVGGASEVQNGYMRFPYIFGKTIKWNQLMQNGNFVDDSGWSKSNSAFTVSNNICTMTATAQGGFIHRGCRQILGHKYLMVATIKLTTATTSIQFSLGGAPLGGNSLATTDWQLMTYFATGATTDTRYIGICDNRSSDWDAVQIKNFMLFDLTDIYGAGKEPTTVAEFVRDFPKPYYPYNAGTPISSKSSSVDFVKRNQWDEECELGEINSSGEVVSGNRIVPKNFIRVLPSTAYYYEQTNVNNLNDIKPFYYDANYNFISAGFWTYANRVQTTPANCAFIKFHTGTAYGTTYNHDICIYINWETPGLPYVSYSKQHIVLPNLELRSAGSAYDVLYQQGGGKRRIGTVDLGTLDYYKSSSPERFEAITKIPSATNIYTTANGICDKYTMVPQIPSSIGLDKVIYCNDGGYVRIQDASLYSLTAEKFKAAMSGVMLYYELATETDITLEENPGWDEYAEIDNFGTVKFNQDPAQDIPVPQAYLVRYTVNLVEFLDSVGERAGFDAGNIALNGELASGDPDTLKGAIDLINTVDGQLKDALCGTLRQLLAVSQSIDFNDTAVVDLGDRTWYYTNIAGGSHYGFVCVISGLEYQTVSSQLPKLICTKYKTITGDAAFAGTTGISTYTNNSYVSVTDSEYTGTDPAEFAKTMKGVLLAYKKASS